MSDVPQHISLGRQFSGRWQIPLLVAALVFLAAGIWRLRPVPKPPAFDELYGRAVAMKDAQLYAESSRYIESLLGDPKSKLSPRERGKLHALMAEVIYAHELGNTLHGQSNAHAIIEHLDAAAAGGWPESGHTHLKRARVWEWLGRAGQAVSEYQQALAKGIEDRWSIRQRIVQIRREQGQATPEWLDAQFDEFVSAPDVSEELCYWAIEQKVILLAEAGKFQEADKLLADHAGRFHSPQWQKYHVYLQALVAYYLERMEDAERQLRVLRDQLVPGHPLYARTGWLLGRIQHSHEAPQPALSFYDDVLSKTTPGPYYTLAMLGRAEVLASLQRYEESVQAYREVIRLAEEQPFDSQVDLQVVRQSTTATYEQLRGAGRLAEAMAYLQIAARLAPPDDTRLQAIYESRQADLAYALGQQAAGRAQRSGKGSAESDRQAAWEAFVASADNYLRLARLTMLDEASSASATWQAADALDLAGERKKRTEVLEAFVRERPDNPRVPEALLRLGQTYQAMDDCEQAIAVYTRALTDFPRTYWAVQCLVPLAECFIGTHQMDKAEQTLLRIVDRRPDEPVAMIRPEAQEYRDALFRLGDLYVQSGEYEKAISRFEEALRRYPEDRRSDRVAFLMADAYRRSAAQIRQDLKDPKKVAFKDALKVQHQERLKRAEELFNQVIERYRSRAKESLADLDQLYLKMSFFYRADAIYDRSYLSDGSDVQTYVQALQRYDEAAWLYQYDPIAMSAYVQIINCHLQMGNVPEARKALQRAAWALRNIPADRFDGSLPGGGREFWEKYLSWLEKTPMFAVARAEG